MRRRCPLYIYIYINIQAHSRLYLLSHEHKNESSRTEPNLLETHFASNSLRLNTFLEKVVGFLSYTTFYEEKRKTSGCWSKMHDDDGRFYIIHDFIRVWARFASNASIYILKSLFGYGHFECISIYTIGIIHIRKSAVAPVWSKSPFVSRMKWSEYSNNNLVHQKNREKLDPPISPLYSR